jgi:GntR family transcriptional regulator
VPDRPQYRLIANALRSEIESGRLGPGDQLPTETELEKTHGVSRNTVRQALDILVTAGLVSAERGRGTFVRDRVMLSVTASGHDTPDSEHWPEYRAVIESQKRQPNTEEIELTFVSPSPEVARRLDVDEKEDLVVQRRAVRQVDGKPALIQTSYYPRDIADGTALARRGDIEEGTVVYLGTLGHPQVGQEDTIVARMPTSRESEDLALGTGVPVLEHYRTAYSVERPIRVTWTVYNGEVFRIVYGEGDLRGRP